MKTQVIKLGALLGVISLVLVSCNKIEDNFAGLTAADILLVQDDVAADDVYFDVDGIVEDKVAELDDAGYQTSMEKSATDDYDCLEVTVDHPDSTRFPKVITFDYGDGCEVIWTQDTFMMEGKMIVTVTDRYHNPGSQRITTFEEFYVNDKQVEGTLTNTYIGLNESGYMEFNFTIEDGKLSFADDNGNELTYTRDADFTRQWLRTRTPLEDTVKMDGSMWGVNAEGAEYSREITETLIMVHCLDYGHRWGIIDGEVTSTVDGEITITDYSESACEGTADILFGGEKFRIRIHKRHRHRHHHGGGQQ